MAKSPVAERMDLVQTQVTGALRPLGFRRAARTYNRTKEPGLIHVVNLQMGQHELGDPIPGFRENLYGMFTVNLGVYVSELDVHPDKVQRKNVPEYLCAIRARLSDLLRLDKDLWWPMDERWPDVAAEVVRGLLHEGIPFLDQFQSRDQIIERWSSVADEYGLSRVARVDIARILAARGQPESAAVYLRSHYNETELPAHREYIERLAAKLGIQLNDS